MFGEILCCVVFIKSDNISKGRDSIEQGTCGYCLADSNVFIIISLSENVLDVIFLLRKHQIQKYVLTACISSKNLFYLFDY